MVPAPPPTRLPSRAIRAQAWRSGDPELRRNLETANTIRLGDGYFRTCLARDDRRRAVCLFVDTTRRPPQVTRDSSQEPNSVFRRR